MRCAIVVATLAVAACGHKLPDSAPAIQAAPAPCTTAAAAAAPAPAASTMPSMDVTAFDFASMVTQAFAPCYGKQPYEYYTCVTKTFPQATSSPDSGPSLFEAASPGLGEKVAALTVQFGDLGKQCATSVAATVTAFHECFTDGLKQVQSSVADNKILSAFVGAVMTTDSDLVACADGDVSEQASCTGAVVSKVHEAVLQITKH